MKSLARRTMLRLYRPDRNPLRRRSDKIEGLVVLALLSLFVGALVVAPVVGYATYRSGVAAERSGHWVTARLLHDAPAITWTSTERQGIDLRTQVVWSVASQVKTGPAVVPRGLKAGATTRVWLDASGEPVAQPPDRAQTMTKAIGEATAVVGFSTLALVIVYAFVQKLLNRRRDAGWDAAWTSADQRWRRREEA